MYCPILKSKRSEVNAIKHLHSDVKAYCTPIIDLAAASTDDQKKNPEQFVARNISAMSSVFSGFGRIYLDSSEIDADLRLPDMTHPMRCAYEKVKDSVGEVIPVSGLYRDGAHWAETLHIATEEGHNTICLRLDRYDLDVPSDTRDAVIELVNDRLSELKIEVLYDLRSVAGRNVPVLAGEVLTVQQLLFPYIGGQAIVAGCGLPEKLADHVSARSSGYVPRVERALWESLRREPIWTQPLAFSDYATVTPDYVEMDWRLIYKMIGPKIIYALSDQWFVIRGGSFEKLGYEQYYELAREVVKLPDFPGSAFSYGDAYVQSRANETDKPGSPASWVTASVNRHLSFTAREIVKYF